MGFSFKIITVFGATGNQGGSVAPSLLQSPGFQVRAITRTPGSVASQKLASLGAGVVQADGVRSDEVRAALQGSWGAFVNLNSDEMVCYITAYYIGRLMAYLPKAFMDPDGQQSLTWTRTLSMQHFGWRTTFRLHFQASAHGINRWKSEHESDEQ